MPVEPMSRTDRLFDIISILRDGKLHRAGDLAARLNVSVRTIYRDMDRLIASGVPVQGARGSGYRATDTIALPPLSLTTAELDALNLGIAIVSEAADPDLKTAARSLADKIDAMLPLRAIPDSDSWKYALSPLTDTARGLSHMASLRSAIKGKQKLLLTCRSPEGRLTTRTIRPLQLDSWGRVWILTAWCELRAGFRDFRLDLIETATPLPELFIDDPGKRLSDRPI